MDNTAMDYWGNTGEKPEAKWRQCGKVEAVQRGEARRNCLLVL